MAAARIAATDSPAPSSVICSRQLSSASRWNSTCTRPVAVLPRARRSSGVSMPCTIALRTSCTAMFLTGCCSVAGTVSRPTVASSTSLCWRRATVSLRLPRSSGSGGSSAGATDGIVSAGASPAAAPAPRPTRLPSAFR